MKLLVITQKVDKNDPVLGFFHRWVEGLSKTFEKVTVICLEKGEYQLPGVKVLSLGKEDGQSAFKYLSRFYQYIWHERADYDAVFVHMNQEYVILGFLDWMLMGKPVYLWRNHAKGNLLTRVAVFFVKKVFYTSPASFTAQFKKSVQMPVGIDTTMFSNNHADPKPNSILILGRISPVKNIFSMIKTVEILQNKNNSFSLDIIGDPVNPEDFEYQKELESVRVGHFSPAMPNYQTPEVYASHEIFFNLTPSGSFDKTILEAAACGCVPFYHTTIENNDQFGGVILPDLDPVKNADRIEAWFADNNLDRRAEIKLQLRNFVEKNHSLQLLMEKLKTEIK